jgi:hypothetical protein
MQPVARELNGGASAGVYCANAAFESKGHGRPNRHRDVQNQDRHYDEKANSSAELPSLTHFRTVMIRINQERR